jgi:hypothetical protein
MIIHIGDEREILLPPVAPLRLIGSRVSSRERMFPLAMGANSYSQLVLIYEAVLPMPQRPLLTSPIQNERG